MRTNAVFYTLLHLRDRSCKYRLFIGVDRLELPRWNGCGSAVNLASDDMGAGL